MALRINNVRKKKRGKIFFYILALLLMIGLVFGVIYLFNVLTNDSDSFVNIGSNQNEVMEEKKPKPKENYEVVQAEIEAYLADKRGVYGYTVIELDDGRSFGARDEDTYTAASSIKVAMAAYIYSQIEAGVIKQDTLLTYTSADYEGGTGSLLADPVGSKYKVSYLLERMIVASDNVATNIITRTYGRTTMQSFIENNGIMGIDIPNNDVTPQGMADLLAAIYDGELISEKNEKLLFDHMKQSITPTRIVAGVPKSVPVAHKIGSWTEAMSDVSVVFAENRAYVLTVYSEGVAWGETTDAVIAGISKAIYDFESSF